MSRKLSTRTFGKGIWKFVIHFFVTVKKKAKRNITMYDSVTVTDIPLKAKAVAGYVDGLYTTFPTLQSHFPHAHKLSIAVSASADARCLDVEKGDATPDEAAPWVRRQLKRGEKKPVVYTSAAFAQNLVNKLDASGLRYGKDYLLWSAHYTSKQHFCSSACTAGLKVKAHATQYKSTTSPNLDTSICSSEFFE